MQQVLPVDYVNTRSPYVHQNLVLDSSITKEAARNINFKDRGIPKTDSKQFQDAAVAATGGPGGPWPPTFC